MENALAKPTSKLNNLAKKLSPFFYGKFLPVQLGLLVTLCYVTETPIIALAIFSLLASFVFLFYEDASPIMPMLFMVVLSFKDFSVMNEIWPYIALAPAIVSFVARFFIHPIKDWTPGLLFAPLILVSMAFALGGILRETYNFMFGIAFFVSLGPTMLIIYLFFYYNVRPAKNFNVKEYLCFSLVVTGIIMIAHIIYNRYILTRTEWYELGWANVNNISCYLLVSLGACFYLAAKAKNIIPWYIVTLTVYAGIFVSGSDAALGIAFAFTPFLLYFTYRALRRRNRKLFFWFSVITITLIASGVVILVALMGTEQMLKFLQIDVTANGRNGIYETAVKLFIENPIFGYGLNYDIESFEGLTSPLRVYNFHSVLLHVMATMGCFGLIAYLAYYVARFIILMRKHTSFTMLMLTAFIMFECYAMVDTSEFNAIPVMASVTVMITVVELVTKKGTVSPTLPLSTNKKYGYNF